MDFLRKYRHLLAGLLILFIALQIPIYWKQDRSLGLPAKVLYTLAYYPQTGYTWVTDEIRAVLRHYVFLVGVAKDNERLTAQTAELRGKLYELRDVEQENERLRAVLDMRDRSRFDAVGARIIALDASTWFQSFTIDAGSDVGLERGMPVVSDEGLVGTVVSVAPRSAKVLPIVDMNSAVDVVDSRSRARGMLVGRGRERAFVNYLERSEDIKDGDLLVTSGLGGAFPPGLPVAVVREVRRRTYGLFQDAYVDTVVKFSRLENVLVLRFTEGEPVPAYVPPLTAPVEAPVAVSAPVAAAPAPLPVAAAEPKREAPAAPKPVVKKISKPVPAEPIGEAPVEFGGPNGPALNLPELEPDDGKLSGGVPALLPADEKLPPKSEKPPEKAPEKAPEKPAAAAATGATP
jgi:rod shape-determining protein MreC